MEFTANGSAETTLPQKVVIVINPEVAAGGTIAEITLLFTTVKEAATPLNNTVVAVENPVPFKVIAFPAAPEEGAKLVNEDAGKMVRFTGVEVTVHVELK